MEIPKTYKNDESLNQSKLKRILEHPRLFIEESFESEFDEPKDHLDIGDAVDLLLTGAEREFHETFAVSKVPRPGGNMGDFCWAKFKYRDFDTADKLAYDEVGIKRPATVEAYLEKFEVEGRAYYDELVGNASKRLLTPSKYETITRIVESIKNNPDVYKHINPENEEYEIHFQVPLYFQLNGVKCKGLCDAIKIHKQTREATVVDVKTTRYSVSNFPLSFFQFRYDFQGAWYCYGLDYDVETRTRLNIKDVASKVIFVVGSSKFPDQSLAYHMEANLVHAAMIGYPYNGKPKEGIYRALERFRYHSKIDKWDYKMEEYEEGFNLHLKLNG